MLDIISKKQRTDTPTHGSRIKDIASLYRSHLIAREQQGLRSKLSKQERVRLKESISEHDTPFIRNGVNFSRFNFEPVLEHYRSGGAVEFETLGPYIESYRTHGGAMMRTNLLNEDAIGLGLAVVFRQLFPNARLVSLYDDYNAHTPSGQMSSNKSGIASFTEETKKTFCDSLIELYRTSGAVRSDATENVDYLLIPESSKVRDAENLVSLLDMKGCIQRKGEEITFVNTQAENPLHHLIALRSSKGKWLCEALDAATFLKAENFRILHIVALPDYMKDQQDKVWEILRVLGISPHRYHNIFYNAESSPNDVATTVIDEFKQHL